MSISGCGKPVEYWVPKGYTYKKLDYKCGNTGIDGYPVLCDDCARKFDARKYEENCAANGERINDDY